MSKITKETTKGLADLLSKSSVASTIQKVEPIIISKEEIKEELVQLNCLFPKHLHQSMKLYSVQNDIPIKKIASMAVAEFLEKEVKA